MSNTVYNIFLDCSFSVALLGTLLEKMPFVGNVKQKTKGMFEHIIDYLAADALKMDVYYHDFGEEIEFNLSMGYAVKFPYFETYSSYLLRKFELNLFVTDIIYYNDFTFAIKVPPKLTHFKILTVLFPLQIWICILITYIVISICWYIFSKFNNSNNVSMFKSFLDIFSLSLSLGITVQDNRPRLKILLMLYAVYAVIMYCLFQGQLSSVIVNPGYEKTIKNIEELADSDKIIYASPGIFESFDYLTDPIALKIKEKFRHAPLNFEDRFTDQVIVLTRDVVEFKIDRGFYKVITNDYLLSQEQTLPLTLGSPYVASFNKHIPKLHENGIVKKIHRDFKNNYTRFDDSNDSGLTVLTLQHLSVAFLVLFVGLGLATIIFIFEIFSAKFCNSKV